MEYIIWNYIRREYLSENGLVVKFETYEKALEKVHEMATTMYKRGNYDSMEDARAAFLIEGIK